MFNKPLDEITYEDIKKLKADKIPESKVLDYKLCYKKEKKDLLNHVCGFANANGGFLVFGIEEDGSKPAIPKNLTGLNEKDFNIERIEQIINDNLDPRLKVEISPPIYKKDKKGKFFVVVRIPEGPDKPYMSTADGDDRFYFRRNFQTLKMSEIEISSMYRQRFSTPQRVKEYLEKTVTYHNEILLPEEDEKRLLIFGHIFIFPPNIESRRLGKIDNKILDRRREGVPSFNGRTISLRGSSGLPFLRGYNSFGLMWSENDSYNRLEFHRNYLIHHVDNYGRVNEHWDTPFPFIDGDHLTFYLLLTLLFSDWAYKEIEYFGPLNIILMIKKIKNIYLYRGRDPEVWPKCVRKKMEIERETNSWELRDSFLEIVKSIMDEFMNYFGRYEYGGFMEGGQFAHLLKKN